LNTFLIRQIYNDSCEKKIIIFLVTFNTAAYTNIRKSIIYLNQISIMKNFRNLSFAILALFSVCFTSCSDNSVEPTGILLDITSNATVGDGVKVATADLPAAITTYISTNYAGKTITKAEKSATKYEVVLSEATQLEFSLTGAFLEVSKGGGIKVSDNKKETLPQVVLDYIAKNYPTATITKAEKCKDKYEVKLSNNLKLEFGLDGAFKKAKS
jgi:Putative beta-lactamase-inhibitor-like, PepSY-like